MYRSDLDFTERICRVVSQLPRPVFVYVCFEVSEQFQLASQQYYLIFKPFMRTELKLDCVNAYAPAMSYCPLRAIARNVLCVKVYASPHTLCQCI